METIDSDVLVIGAGMAGATTAAHLAADRRVALIEAEEQAGYHSTGRSAALWYLNYGPPDVRELTRLSRPFLEAPPAGFAGAPLLAHRPVMVVAGAPQLGALEARLATGAGLRRIGLDAARRLVPALRADQVADAALEDDAFDIDVAALHQGYLRQIRAAGGALALRRRSQRIARRGGRWEVEATGGETFAAPVLVDAAGAWADEVALQAGVAPLGLVPKRRTAVLIDPAPWDVAGWPLVEGMGESFYARPDAGRLFVSPADETPTHPQDVQPEELDIALAIARMQEVLAIDVRRVERSWAGLRTFAPDGSLAIGWDARAEGFFWCAGQGGYGIQTAPAAGRLAADLIAGRDAGAAACVRRQIDPARLRADATA